MILLLALLGALVFTILAVTGRLDLPTGYRSIPPGM
jgi:hypothetical protein